MHSVGCKDQINTSISTCVVEESHSCNFCDSCLKDERWGGNSTHKQLKFLWCFENRSLINTTGKGLGSIWIVYIQDWVGGGGGTPRKSWLGVLPSSQNPDHYTFSDQIMPFYTLVVRTSLPTWLLKVVLSLQTHNLVLVSFSWPYTLVVTSVIGSFFCCVKLSISFKPF